MAVEKKELVNVAKPKATRKPKGPSMEDVLNLLTPEQRAELEAKQPVKVEKAKKLSAKQEALANFKLIEVGKELLDKDGSFPVALESLIPLEKLPIPNATYAQRETNREHAEHLKLALEAGATLPPIKIVATSDGYAVIDGYHRWAANELLLAERVAPENLDNARATTFIRVIPLNGLTPRKVIQAAFEANLTNGMPMSVGSRTRYGVWLLEDARERGEKLGLNEAARIAQVKHSALSMYIKRKADKDKKMVDEFLDEADAAEVAELAQEADSVNEEDKMLAAVKRFFAAMRTIVDIEDNHQVLVQYILEHANADKIRADVDFFSKVLHDLGNHI